MEFIQIILKLDGLFKALKETFQQKLSILNLDSWIIIIIIIIIIIVIIIIIIIIIISAVTVFVEFFCASARCKTCSY